MAKDCISDILNYKNLHYLELFISYESSFCPLIRSLCEAVKNTDYPLRLILLTEIEEGWRSV